MISLSFEEPPGFEKLRDLNCNKTLHNISRLNVKKTIKIAHRHKIFSNSSKFKNRTLFWDTMDLYQKV